MRGLLSFRFGHAREQRESGGIPSTTAHAEGWSCLGLWRVPWRTCDRLVPAYAKVEPFLAGQYLRLLVDRSRTSPLQTGVGRRRQPHGATREAVNKAQPNTRPRASVHRLKARPHWTDHDVDRCCGCNAQFRHGGKWTGTDPCCDDELAFLVGELAEVVGTGADKLPTSTTTHRHARMLQRAGISTSCVPALWTASCQRRGHCAKHRARRRRAQRCGVEQA